MRQSLARLKAGWALGSILLATVASTVTPAFSQVTSRGLRTGAKPAAEKPISTLPEAVAAVPNFPLSAQVAPRFRHQMTNQIGPIVRQALELGKTAKKSNPKQYETYRGTLCVYAAQLALYGDADIVKELEEASQSTNPADKNFGTLALIMVKWWEPKEPDEEYQKTSIAKLEEIAAATPNDNALPQIYLNLSEIHVASMEIGESLRKIVENTMKSPAAREYVARPDKIGRPFVVNVNTLDGKSVSTRNWLGKVVVVDFWATWCPPCRAEMPGMIEFYKEHHGEGVEYLGISNDHDRNALTAYLKENADMTWAQSVVISPAWHPLAGKLKVRSIPRVFVIDRAGRLRFTGHFDAEVVKALLTEPTPDANEPVDKEALKKGTVTAR